MTRDTWHVTCDTWHVTHDIWHKTHRGWGSLCPNFRSLALIVWELWCFEDWEENSHENGSKFRGPVNTAGGKRQAAACDRFSPNLGLPIWLYKRSVVMVLALEVILKLSKYIQLVSAVSWHVFLWCFWPWIIKYKLSIYLIYLKCPVLPCFYAMILAPKN